MVRKMAVIVRRGSKCEQSCMALLLVLAAIHHHSHQNIPYWCITTAAPAVSSKLNVSKVQDTWHCHFRVPRQGLH